MDRVSLAISFVALVVGLLWIGQGTGAINGFALGNQAIWAVIGVDLVIASAGIAWSARRRPLG